MSYKLYTDSLNEFIDTFDPPATQEFWLTLVDEEAKELVEATQHVLKELADFLYVNSGLIINTPPDAPKAEMPEAVAQAFSVAFKLINVFGDDVVKTAFLRVHESNMSKLGENGKPIRRDDGKILKGPNYVEADMSGVF